MDKDLDGALESAAEPVKSTAQGLAVSRIRKMPYSRSGWDHMRIGITAHTVYVAPVNRRGGTGRRRPNLFDLLLERSLQPALDENVGRVEREVSDAVRDMGRAWSRV